MLGALLHFVWDIHLDFVAGQVRGETLVTRLFLLAAGMPFHLDTRFLNRLGQPLSRVGRLCTEIDLQLIRVVNVPFATTAEGQPQ